jgi:hypothetical protein
VEKTDAIKNPSPASWPELAPIKVAGGRQAKINSLSKEAVQKFWMERRIWFKLCTETPPKKIIENAKRIMRPEKQIREAKKSNLDR